VRIAAGLVIVILIAGSRALADVSGISLTVNAPSYSGPCPAAIVFVATVSGDPRTVFGFTFSGDGFPQSKTLYAFITDSGVRSVDDEISVDSAHAGSFNRQVEVTRYERGIGGSMVSKGTLKSVPIAVSVTCMASTPSPAPAVPVYDSLNGVAVGDAPALVLARLGLHPPGWARGAQSGATQMGEVRQFPTDAGNATMMLLFDTSIQVVMVQALNGKRPSIIDPYGIKLNDPLDRLTSLRGKADKVEDKSVQGTPNKSDTIDHSDVWRGLHDPVESDSTYIYGRDDSIRWEYTIKNNQVSSIRIVDCRVAGTCTAAKHG
jgi:hypothetical protein